MRRRSLLGRLLLAPVVVLVALLPDREGDGEVWGSGLAKPQWPDCEECGCPAGLHVQGCSHDAVIVIRRDPHPGWSAETIARVRARLGMA